MSNDSIFLFKESFLHRKRKRTTREVFEQYWCAGVFVIALIAMLAALFSSVISTNKNNESFLNLANKMNYNAKDVEVFCEMSGASIKQFVDSPSLRIEYQRWAMGHPRTFAPDKNENINNGLATAALVYAATSASRSK